MTSVTNCDSDEEYSPKFDFSDWNPEPPAGLSYISLLPMQQVWFSVNKIEYMLLV